MSYVEFIVPGYDWHSPEFQIKTAGVATNITGWELTAQFFWRGRNSSSVLDPSNVLLTLVSGTTYFTVTTAATGKFEFDLVGSSQTSLFDQTPNQLPGPQQVLACRLTRTDGSLNEFLADIKIPVRF